MLYGPGKEGRCNDARRAAPPGARQQWSLRSRSRAAWSAPPLHLGDLNGACPRQCRPQKRLHESAEPSRAPSCWMAELDGHLLRPSTGPPRLELMVASAAEFACTSCLPKPQSLNCGPRQLALRFWIAKTAALLATIDERSQPKALGVGQTCVCDEPTASSIRHMIGRPDCLGWMNLSCNLHSLIAPFAPLLLRTRSREDEGLQPPGHRLRLNCPHSHPFLLTGAVCNRSHALDSSRCHRPAECAISTRTWPAQVSKALRPDLDIQTTVPTCLTHASRLSLLTPPPRWRVTRGTFRVRLWSRRASDSQSSLDTCQIGKLTSEWPKWTENWRLASSTPPSAGENGGLARP